MSGKLERVIRIRREHETMAKPVDYWHARPAQERLLETLNLHREGNDWFKGGNPPFQYVIKVRHVDGQ